MIFDVLEFFTPEAQEDELLALNQKVMGSKPIRGTEVVIEI